MKKQKRERKKKNVGLKRKKQKKEICFKLSVGTSPVAMKCALDAISSVLGERELGALKPPTSEREIKKKEMRSMK